MSFWGALQLLFIGLKLGGVLDWSWWAVAAPTITWAIVLGGVLALHTYYMRTDSNYALKHYLNQLKKSV